MRKKLLITLIVVSCTLTAQEIKLPAPFKSGGKPLMEVLNNRQTSRVFSEKELSYQTLSNLLWAAWGYNRENKRTAPSSRDCQEIDLYISMKFGLYLYDAKNNKLVQIIKDDIRALCGKQEFVCKAPLNLIYVCNKSKIVGKDEQGLIEATYANTGFIAQNVYLFSSSEGLNCVIRAMIDKEALGKRMNLSSDQIITLSQTVGYKK